MKDYTRIRQIWESLSRCTDNIQSTQRVVMRQYGRFMQMTGARRLERETSIPIKLSEFRDE